MRLPVCIATLAGVATAIVAQDAPTQTGMMRFPDVSATHIVFSYANDLWLAPRDGGQARPLASPPGQEVFARFSPDGRSIAFMGNYEGGRDIYTVSTSGGPAHRVTHHPATEVLHDWHKTGKLIFSTNGLSGIARNLMLFTVDPEGGLPEQLPVPYGSMGAISDDGVWLAYTPQNRDTRTWKRYQGGLASDIWLFNLETKESRRLTEWAGTDTQPMWIGKDLYYLSDAGPEMRLNIWKADIATGRLTQVTRFDDHDCKFPAVGPGERGRGEIVFQNGASLYLLDAPTGATRRVDITIPGDAPRLRAQTVMGGDFIASGAVSATGKRAVVEARGDIWTIPAEHGSPRRITATVDAAERYPSWSPSGKWIAYFSDESGEYELHIAQSDGQGEARQLTSASETFYFGGVWSPDSKHYAYTDKSGKIFLTTIESGETRLIDTDPWASQTSLSWSGDSRYLTYSQPKTALTSVIVIYDTEENEKRTVTSGFFNDSSPAFSRDGNWLYYVSNREFTSPTYEDVGSTFIYNSTGRLIAAPLRADVAYPRPAKNDEETWSDEDEDAETDEADESAGEDAGDAGDDEADAKSPIHGVWEGTASGLAAMGLPEDEMPFTVTIVDNGDGTFSGESSAMGETSPYDTVEFDASTGALTMRRSEGPVESTQTGTLSGDRITGTWTINAPALGINASGAWNATRTGAEPKPSTDSDDGAPARKEGDPVTIDFEGLEARAIALPVAPGTFANLTTNDRSQLIYMRVTGGTPSIRLFDISEESPSEKTVVPLAMGFSISGDGKKLGVMAPGGLAIVSAAPGQSVASTLDLSNLRMRIDPRSEWRQLVRDAWRRHRDFFYVENMHGVDWDAVWEQYSAMLDHAVSREDVSYIIGEMISELNVGHAYYWGGDVEEQPIESVGMLGVDYKIVEIPEEMGERAGRSLPDRGYAIAKFYEGAAWDTDARNPLRRWDLKINEGDVILAVNGVPIDVDQDPWAPFVGLAGRSVTLTILSMTPEPEAEPEAGNGVENGDGSADSGDDAEEAPKIVRDIQIVLPGSESTLRYRAWIENNRRMVEELSDGRVGYIYVPDTGVNGQNDLFRQFYGQVGKDALLIDERWNGGGQIPNRFIELLNRPRTNYWHRRDGKDWPWPYDSHQGPKAMLINGAAGSGGDMFPWLFRHHEIGALIGTRTWGGLVGITGVPPLIDGGYTAVPTFGFYTTEGQWSIEGYGVAPDHEVLDDPAKMQNGRDPQIEFGVEHLIRELRTRRYTPPTRPAAPDRSGMGIDPAHR